MDLTLIEALLTTETNIKIGSVDILSPGNVCCIRQYSGELPEINLVGQLKVRVPMIQIYVRDTIYVNGYNRCENMITSLQGKHSNYDLTLQGDIVVIGKNERNESEFTINFKCRWFT